MGLKQAGVSIAVSIGGLLPDSCELLPPFEGLTHGGLVRALVALEHGLRFLPPAQVTQVFQRGVLELRGEFPAEAMPTKPRLMGDPRQFLAPLPPVPN